MRSANHSYRAQMDAIVRSPTSDCSGSSSPSPDSMGSTSSTKTHSSSIRSTFSSRSSTSTGSVLDQSSQDDISTNPTELSYRLVSRLSTASHPSLISESSQLSAVSLSRRRNVLRARLKAAVRVVCRNIKMNNITTDFARAPSPMSDAELCRTCAKLKLTRSDFLVPEGAATDIVGSNGVQSYRLGHLESICSRAYGGCHLCRLIMKALAQQPYERLDTVMQSIDTGNTFDDLNSVCFATWEIDGVLSRSREDGQPGFINIPKTRRLRIHWQRNSFEKFYIIMMASPDKSEPPDFLGRHIEGTREDKEKLIGKWLSICGGSHGPSCRVRPEDNERFEELRRGPYFGVIDVEEMCFKALPKDARYVALSYYWGDGSGRRSFTSKRSNILKIKERNGLSEHFENLPRTIRDTIELVRNLGLRYLWVDSICLVTDVSDAWCRNARTLDLVYGQACLTICAAEGENAEAGLRALEDTSEREHSLKTEECVASYSSDLHLLARFPSEMYVAQSKWNSRAWAFQERLFSKRCLIFTNGRMYFECGTTAMSEDVDLESPRNGWSLDYEQSHKKDWKYASADIVKSYMGSVALYTSRDLHAPTERLDAFEPIGKLIFNRLGGRLVYGLPNSHFDWALLWSPQAALTRGGQQSRDSVFPSWSWCGWDSGLIQYDRRMIYDCMEDLHAWLMNHTWITWYIRDPNGNLRLVWDAQHHAQKDDDVDQRWRGYSSENASRRGYDHYGRAIPKRWIGQQRNSFVRTLPDFPVQVYTLQPGESSANIARGWRSEDLPYLQFWTWSAYFYLEPAREDEFSRYYSSSDFFEQNKDYQQLQTTPSSLITNQQKPGSYNNNFTEPLTAPPTPVPAVDKLSLRRYNILDEHRRWVGEITISSRWPFNRRRAQPFIAISDAKNFAYGPDFLREDNSDDDDTFLPTGFVDGIDDSDDYDSDDPYAARASEPWPLYNVFLLDENEAEDSPGDDWRRNQIAYRVGLGKVYKEAFEHGVTGLQRQSKKWREVVLG